MAVFFSAVIFGVILPPIVGFVIGRRQAFGWIWLGIVTAGLIEVMQVHVEGSVGTWASGQDWHSWLMNVAVWCAISFYGSLAFGVVCSLLLPGGRPGGESAKQ
jgi:hypothetical protein